MISKAERQHIVALKNWSHDTRAALRDFMAGPMGVILKKTLASKSDMLGSEVVFDNVDWLIALIERESHTAGVKGILKAVEDHEAVSGGRS
jgi:hypothetical protein